MITPILLNRLKWKGYLIFMVTNFAFVPLVYFCYPETANLTLEEIDLIFADHDKSTVKYSKELCKERRKGGSGERKGSLVQNFGAERRASRFGSDATKLGTVEEREGEKGV